MNLLILKGFNNYFNRKIKKYSEVDDYITAALSFKRVTYINFNPADGVVTSIVLGQGQLGDFLDFEKTGSADYVVCYNTVPDTENDTSIDIIDSRWFITDINRTRGGQFTVKLKRDSIADHFDTLINCPAFIKKGIVSDDNHLILNDEGIAVNQIKSGETLLKDGSNSAWIVGYLSKDFVDRSVPTDPISVQVPAGDYESVTIEDLAAELRVSATVLEQILVTDPNNQVRFINDNIEIVGWLNYNEGTPLEVKIIAGSRNGLQSFDYSESRTESHSRWQDCFAVGIGPYPENHTFWKEALSAPTIRNNWESITHNPFLTRKVYDKLVELQKNKTLIYKAGLYYQVVVSSGSVTNTGETYYDGADSTLFDTPCDNYCTRINTFAGHTASVRRTGGTIFINYNELTANIYLTNKITDVNVPKVSVDMSTSRNAVLNQPFDMFAIPFNDTVITNGADTYEVTGDCAQKLAIALMAVETKGQIYDIQLLPYCPIPEIAREGGIDISNKTVQFDYDWVDYNGELEKYNTSTPIVPIVNEYSPGEYEATATYQSTITDTDLIDWGWNAYNAETEPHAQQAFDEWVSDMSTSKTVVGGKSKFTIYNQVQDPQSFEHADITVVFWFKWKENGVEHRSIIVYPKNNSFSVNLNYNLSLKESMKIDSQTDLYRLVSPNYQGSFDFNVAKNGGTVNGFIADCTYKPYTPYIKVAPQFAWLYGTNFGDARGLICAGDFSVGFYSDRWQEYQLQNKNYQNIFNREIQNLDINQGIARTQQYVTGGIGIVRDTITGAAGGAIATGSPYGAIAGAVIGGAASTAGYFADNAQMEKSMIEQRQFAIDKFNMQLENIQALPYTLTKVGAFNINTKIWPFLEYYTCTDEEKQALRMKIQYEGMTVGIIDVLGNWMNGGFLQADLIRNEEIIDDNHQLEDIYVELTKGVYL